MNYIIFDLEWNQSPVETAVVTQPLLLEGEIIEIGAVKLNGTFEPVDELRLYIRPQYYTKLHRRIASLTGIHDRDLQEKGLPFPEAFARFMEWCGEEFAYMTWSMSDMPALIDNMRLHGIDTSELPVCYDIQRVFGREIMRSDTRYSLDTAIAILHEKGDTAHDALHDARNTAKVCAHLDLEEYLEEYGAKVFVPEPYCMGYESREAALTDEWLERMPCPWCEDSVSWEPWLPWEHGDLAAEGLCGQEDEFLAIRSLTNLPDGSCYTKTLLYEMSEDLWELLQKRKETAGAAT